MKKAKTILTDSMIPQILKFAIPIALTSILQQMFQSTDTIIVGWFAGSDALAAVGCTSSIVGLCITIMLGLSAGVNVRISQKIGEKSSHGLQRMLEASFVIALVTGISLTIVGEGMIQPLLRVLGTPEMILPMSIRYLSIYMAGILFLVFSNVETAILRAGGDTKRPLYSLFFSGALNLVLNVIFVSGFHMGVAGVALGTVLADAVNAGILFYFLKQKRELRAFGSLPQRVRWVDIRDILSISIPAALQEMMFIAANLIMQSGFNRLGADAVAASTVSLNAEMFIYYLLNAFGQSAITWNGRYYGAGDTESCRRATRYCMAIGGGAVALFSGGFLLLARPFAGLFVTEEAVIILAMQRMRIVLSFELFDLTIEVLTGAMRGLGRAGLPAAVSAVFICGTRIAWVILIFPKSGTYASLNAAFPASWGLACLFIIIGYGYIRNKFLTIRKAV